MFTAQEITAKYPTKAHVFMAPVAELRKMFAGYLKTSTAKKADYEEMWVKLQGGSEWAENAMQKLEQYLASLLPLEPELVVGSFEERGYAPKTQKAYATKLFARGYAHKKQLLGLLGEVYEASSQQDKTALASRLNAQWDEAAADKFVKAVYAHAKTVLSVWFVADEWDLALAIQLVTGRRFAEIAKMELANGMFCGKAKGKNGQYAGVWFPLFQFCDVTEALKKVQANCGPCETPAQAVKWTERTTARLAYWPKAPGEITGKYYRKIYAAVAKKLPHQFPMPANWEAMAPVARASWLLGHQEADYGTQNSYEIFECSKERAIKVLRMFQ